MRTINGDYVVTQAGAVVQDLRIYGSLIVNAPNVTIRRVEIIGGHIDNRARPTCQDGMLIENSTVRRGSAPTRDTDVPAISTGGYTARGVLIIDVPQGFRVGGANDGNCGPVVIENSYARIVRPDVCNDWHGDGIQGYDGPALTVRNTVLELVQLPGCGGGTAPFFYPSNQGNTSVDIDGLIVIGGGYPFRLGMPGTVKQLKIVEGSWFYGPINVKCSAVASWDADIVRLTADGQPIFVRSQPCNTELGD